MPRRCELTGTRVSSGNNVSHSNRRTRRTFSPNLQNVTLLSDALGERVRMRVTVAALRTVQKRGGIDAYLLGTDDAKLAPEALAVKRRVRRAVGTAKRA